jgi:hypothetical protein
VRRARIKIHFHPSHLTGPENGATLPAQTVKDIVTKLGTFTHRTIPLTIAEPKFQNSSARGLFVGENFSHFAPWRSYSEFKKSEKNPQGAPYRAQGLVEVSSLSHEGILNEK